MFYLLPDFFKILTKNDEFFLVKYYCEFMRKLSFLVNKEKIIVFIDHNKLFKVQESNPNVFLSKQHNRASNIKFDFYNIKKNILKSKIFLPNIINNYCMTKFRLNEGIYVECISPKGPKCMNIEIIDNTNLFILIDNKSIREKILIVGNNLYNFNDLDILLSIFDQTINKTLYFSIFKGSFTFDLDHSITHNYLKTKDQKFTSDLGHSINHNYLKTEDKNLLNNTEILLVIYRTVLTSIKLYFSNLLKICFCVKEFNDFLESNIESYLNKDLQYTENDLRKVFEKFKVTKNITINYFSEKNKFFIEHKDNLSDKDQDAFNEDICMILYYQVIISAISRSIYTLSKPNKIYSLNKKLEAFDGINIINTMEFLHIMNIDFKTIFARGFFFYSNFESFILQGINIFNNTNEKNNIFFYAFYLNENENDFDFKTEKEENSHSMLNSLVQKLKEYFSINSIKITVYLEFQLNGLIKIKKVNQKIINTNSKNFDKLKEKLFKITVKNYAHLSEWIDFKHYA